MQDTLTLLSNAQSIAFAAGSDLSTSSIDIGAPTRDAGIGFPAIFEFDITEAVTSGGSATVNFEIVSAADAALSSGLVSHAQTGALAYTALTLGARLYLVIPPGSSVKRYVGARYTVATATTTAGKVTAKLVPTAHSFTGHPDVVSGASY